MSGEINDNSWNPLSGLLSRECHKKLAEKHRRLGAMVAPDSNRSEAIWVPNSSPTSRYSLRSNIFILIHGSNCFRRCCLIAECRASMWKCGRKFSSSTQSDVVFKSPKSSEFHLGSTTDPVHSSSVAFWPLEKTQNYSSQPLQRVICILKH